MLQRRYDHPSDKLQPMQKNNCISTRTKMRKKIVWALGRFSKDERAYKVLQSIADDSQEHTEIIREARWSLKQLDGV